MRAALAIGIIGSLVSLSVARADAFECDPTPIGLPYVLSKVEGEWTYYEVSIFMRPHRVFGSAIVSLRAKKMGPANRQIEFREAELDSSFSSVTAAALKKFGRRECDELEEVEVLGKHECMIRLEKRIFTVSRFSRSGPTQVSCALWVR